MSASQLQHYLTDKIYSIQDEEFLSALKILVDTKEASHEVYHLNKRQNCSPLLKANET